MANQIKLNLGSSLSDLRSTASLLQQLNDAKIKNQMAIYDYFDKRATDEINNITNDFKNIDYVKGLIDNGTYDKVSQERYNRAVALANKYGKQAPMTAKQYMEKEYYDDFNSYLANLYKAGGSNDKGSYEMLTMLHNRKWGKKYKDSLFGTDFANQQRDTKFNQFVQEESNKYMMNTEPEQYIPDQSILNQIEDLKTKLKESEGPFKQLEENYSKEGADSNDVNNYDAAKNQREGWMDEIKSLDDKLKDEEEKWKQEHAEPNNALESVNKQLSYMDRVMNQTTPISIDLLEETMAKNAWNAGQASYTAEWDLKHPNAGEEVTKIFNTISKSDIDKYMLLDDNNKEYMIKEWVKSGVFRSLPDSYEKDILNNPKDWITYFRKDAGYKQQFADWVTYMKYYPEFRLTVMQQMQNFVKSLPVTVKTDVNGLRKSIMGLIKDIYNEVPDIILDDYFYEMLGIYIQEELQGKFDNEVIKQAFNDAQLQLKQDTVDINKMKVVGNINNQQEKNQLGWANLEEKSRHNAVSETNQANRLNETQRHNITTENINQEKFVYKQQQDANKGNNKGQPIINKHFGYYDGTDFYDKKGSNKKLLTNTQITNIMKATGDYNIANIIGYLDNKNNSLNHLTSNSLTNEGKSELLKYYRTFDSYKQGNVFARAGFGSLNERTCINTIMKTGIGTDNNGQKRKYNEYNLYEYILESLTNDKYQAATIAHKINSVITNMEINAINAKQNYL